MSIKNIFFVSQVRFIANIISFISEKNEKNEKKKMLTCSKVSKPLNNSVFLFYLV